MNFKLLGTGLAALTILATSFTAQAATYLGVGVRPVVAYYNWTGFASVSTADGWGSSNWDIPWFRRSPKAGCSAARSATAIRSARSDRAREATSWADIQGQRVVRDNLRNQNCSTIVPRYSVSSPGCLLHRRRRLRQRQGHRQRSDRSVYVGKQQPTRLDRRRRPGIRLPRQLERQDRISLRRSRQVRHRLHRADRGQCFAQGKHHPRRPELQVLRTDLLPLLIDGNRTEAQKLESPGPWPGAFFVATVLAEIRRAA